MNDRDTTICCIPQREKGENSMEKHMRIPMSRDEAASLKAGDYVYLTGTIYTARDAAHKRMDEALERG